MSSNKQKFIEDKFFYKLFNFTYKYLMLNIYFLLTTFVFFYLTSINDNLFVLLSIYSFIIFFTGVNFGANILYFRDDENAEVEPGVKNHIRYFKKSFKNNWGLLLIAVTIFLLLYIDLLFLILNEDMIILLPLFLVMCGVFISVTIVSIIIKTLKGNYTIITTMKSSFVLSFTNWPVSLLNIALVLLVVYLITLVPRVGFMILPSIVTHLIYKKNVESVEELPK